VVLQSWINRQKGAVQSKAAVLETVDSICTEFGIWNLSRQSTLAAHAMTVIAQDLVITHSTLDQLHQFSHYFVVSSMQIQVIDHVVQVEVSKNLSSLHCSQYNFKELGFH
jgi:hypothetical protein